MEKLEKSRVQLTILDEEADNLRLRTLITCETYAARVRRALRLLDAIEDGVESVYDSVAEVTYTIKRTANPTRSI